MTLLNIDGLTVQYRTGKSVANAVVSVNLEVGQNELLAVVGESGCGKTTLGLSIIGLLPVRTSRIVNGSIDYKGTQLTSLGQKGMRYYRGTEIAMIFQEPLTSLNPVYKVGDQMAEAIALRRLRKDGHKNVTGEVMQRAYSKKGMYFSSKLPFVKRSIPSELRDEIKDWLTLVRIPDPEHVLDSYPFELSGGMQQRVMIAMALSEEPALLIADEPTTALDVTTQAQVLKLMRELMDKVNTSILLITHDLAVASQVADRVAVMYTGEIVENADVHELFSNPQHPYTKGLLNCIPKGTKSDSRLVPIPGSIPDLSNDPKCCSFAPRCPYAFDRCRSDHPDLTMSGGTHKVACFLYDK